MPWAANSCLLTVLHLFSGIFVLICILSLTSSLYDEKWAEPKSILGEMMLWNVVLTNCVFADAWLTVFSVKRNWRELTSTKRSEDDIRAVHGVRFLNAILIFLCHKSVESLLPSKNRTEMALQSAGVGSIVIRMCALYTDVFLMLSGMLVAYSMTKTLQRGQKINMIREVTGRYIRVMPNIIATMLTTAYVIPRFVQHGNPHRALVIEKPAELCKTHGWRNVLLIHNWFKFEDMCNLHTHHVGSDFELFLIAPVLLTILWKFPKRGSMLVLFLAAVSTAARFHVTFANNLMYFVPFGAKLSKLLETANLLYTLPTHRFTVYGIGLLLGFVLRRYNTTRPSKTQFIVGEIVNGVLLTIVVACGVAMTGIDVNYNAMLHSLYAAFMPIVYCARVAWIIFSSHQGHKSECLGFLCCFNSCRKNCFADSFNRFLEWKGFVVTTKFCYAFYLIQIPIFQLSIGNMRDVQFTNSSALINLNEIFVICGAATLMTLFIETPCNNLKKLWLKPDSLDVNSNETTKKVSWKYQVALYGGMRTIPNDNFIVNIFRIAASTRSS